MLEKWGVEAYPFTQERIEKLRCEVAVEISPDDMGQGFSHNS